MRRTLATLAVATLAGAAVLVAAPAWAHSQIVASTPSEGETLTALPDAFSVTANETLLDLGGQGVFALQIRDADGRYYGDGCVRVVDATMSADPAIGASGDYEMLWQVVSADGHPVSGTIDFTWQAPDVFTPSPALDAAPTCGEQPGNADEPPATGDSSSIALWIGVGVAVLGGLVAILSAVVVVARRGKGGPTSPSGPGGSSGT